MQRGMPGEQADDRHASETPIPGRGRVEMKTGEKQKKLPAGGDELRVAAPQGGEHHFPRCGMTDKKLEAETQFKAEGVCRAGLVIFRCKIR